MIVKDNELQQTIEKIDIELKQYEEIFKKVKDLKTLRKNLQSRLNELNRMHDGKDGFIHKARKWINSKRGGNYEWILDRKTFPYTRNYFDGVPRYKTVNVKCEDFECVIEDIINEYKECGRMTFDELLTFMTDVVDNGKNQNYDKYTIKILHAIKECVDENLHTYIQDW